MKSVLGWLLFAAVSLAIAADGETKRYALPDNTSLELSIPAGWQDDVKQGESGTPPTIAFTPRAGPPFQAFVTPIWRPRPEVPVASAEQIRQSVQRAAEQVQPRAAESSLPVDELSGAKGPGYYFSATDKAPKPEEFKYLTQGMLLVGELAVTFSILTNDGQEKMRDAALDMLKRAAQVKP
jgi:hypothetical protein